MYTAKVRTDGDRNGGIPRSDYSRLDLTHTPPVRSGKATRGNVAMELTLA